MSIDPGSGRSPGEGNGNLLQCSCLENSMDRAAWWAIVHGVTESDATEWLTHTSIVNTVFHSFSGAGLWECLRWAVLAWIFAAEMSAGVVGSVSKEASQVGCWSILTAWWLGCPRMSSLWGDQGGNCLDLNDLDWEVLLGRVHRFLITQASHDSVGGWLHKSGGARWQGSLGAILEAGYHGTEGTCVISCVIEQKETDLETGLLVAG